MALRKHNYTPTTTNIIIPNWNIDLKYLYECPICLNKFPIVEFAQECEENHTKKRSLNVYEYSL